MNKFKHDVQPKHVKVHSDIYNDAVATMWFHGQEVVDLRMENEKLKQFVNDCSVSHNETRYKYRAQVILKELSNNKNKRGGNNEPNKIKEKKN